MPKAMIITVGKQCEQIKICLNDRKPEYLVLLGTNSRDCENSIDELLNYCRLSPTNFKIYDDIKDNPTEIGNIIRNFKNGLDWLTKQLHIPESEIEVDPTGGRKWMSAGVIMIASFMGLKMCYVQDKSESEPEKVTPLGNAYDQTGFLEEDKADKLFNEYNFSVASSVYNFLSQKLQDPRKVEIKELISNGYLHWCNFDFSESYKYIESAIQKIEQYKTLEGYTEQLKMQIGILRILKKNDFSHQSYFNLLKEDNFVEDILLTLIAQTERFAKNKQYDLATILLYRILELIAQYRLAKKGIDAGNISQEIRKKYSEQYKKITKEVFQAESEIPDKIALVQCWILLFCLKDELLKNQEIGFFRGLRKNIEPRNKLWLEHGNKIVEESEYQSFYNYAVGIWFSKVSPNRKTKIKGHYFIKF